MSLKLTIILIISMALSACGGGSSSINSSNYCVLNTNPDHFSPSGNCFQIKEVTVTDYSDTANDEVNIYEVNRDIYISLVYDENDFVGDLSIFKQELTFQSDDIGNSQVEILEPHDFIGGWVIKSTAVGKVTLTLVVKDESDAILDSKTVEIKIVN